MRSAFFIFSSLLLLVVVGLSAFAADYPSAEKDIYGNTIYTNGTGEVTYRFIVSGDTQDALSSSNSVCLASNDDVALDAVFKSVWASVGGWLYSTKCGFVLLFR